MGTGRYSGLNKTTPVVVVKEGSTVTHHLGTVCQNCYEVNEKTATAGCRDIAYDIREVRVR